MYADNVLILREATHRNCHALNQAIELFAQKSCLHINYNKSSIIFSPSIRTPLELSRIPNMHNFCDHLTYPGLPVSYKKLKVRDFQDIIHKI